MNKWCAYVCGSRERLAVPIMTHPGIKSIGRKVIEAVSDGEVQFQAISAIQEEYGTAAATMMMDLTVEAEAFGAVITFADDEVPTVAKGVVSSRESIEALRIPALEAGRVPQYLKAARLAAESITDKPVLAGCIGPFSLAGRLFGMAEIMTALYIEPEAIKSLLTKATAFLREYARQLKMAGAHGIIVAEPAAGLLSPELCDEFSSGYVKELVERLQDDNFLVVLHNCGNKGHVTGSMRSTGAGALHFGNAIDIVPALRELPADVLVMGNLDPAGIFKLGTRQKVFSAATELLQRTAEYRNFVISSGCDVPPGVPLENVAAFFEAVDAFNAKRK